MTAERLSLLTGKPRLELTRLAETPAAITVTPQGPSGKPGPQGDIGMQGSQGDPGEVGLRGPPGDTTVKIVAASGVQAIRTGSTAEGALVTVSIPARAMGASGRLRVVSLWSATNSGNSKTARIRFGGMSGTIYHEHAFPSQLVHKAITEIDNRTTGSQIGKPITMEAYGDSTSALVTSTIDTTAAVDLCFTGQLTSSGEQIRLEAYIVELLMPPEQAQLGLYYEGDGIVISESFQVLVDRNTVPPVTTPHFLGSPTAPTPDSVTNSTRIATTEFVQTWLATLATTYLTYDVTAARTQLGLGALAYLDDIAFSQIDGTLVASVADYRQAVDSKFMTPAKAFSAHAYVTLTDAAVIAVDFATGFNFTVTLTSNRTLGFPTNPKVGQNGFIDIVQPSAGSKLIDYGAGYTFDGGVPPSIDTAANRVTSLYYHVRSTDEVRIGLAFRGVR